MISLSMPKVLKNIPCLQVHSGVYSTTSTKIIVQIGSDRKIEEKNNSHHEHQKLELKSELIQVERKKSPDQNEKKSQSYCHNKTVRTANHTLLPCTYVP